MLLRLAGHLVCVIALVFRGVRSAVRKYRAARARPVVEACARMVPEWRRTELGEAIDAKLKEGLELKAAISGVMRDVATAGAILQRRGYERRACEAVDEVAWLALEAERRARIQKDWDRYGYLSSDPTRTDAEDRELATIHARLVAAGVDLGLPPVPRDAQ